LRATAAGHREDFERERDRTDKLMAELLKATAELVTAKETTAKLGGELAVLRVRPVEAPCRLTRMAGAQHDGKGR
jgi:hypothetical protein